ncbi:hypothetical protein ACQPW1_10260 [Nocardia sp. CA-128927]|uniref:hypothetical protein n=1 Tax=Nocardia sp. CA-128927 TaxID=3239975 RepID=UPI003D95A10A
MSTPPPAIEVASLVAQRMGPEWTPSLGRRHRDAAWIYGPDGQALRLETGGYKVARGSVRVFGELRDIKFRGVATPSIQMSLRKSPDRMADEIRRRLLPVYTARRAEDGIRRNEAKRVERVKRSCEARLAQILKAQSVGPYVGLFANGGRVVVENDETVKFEFRIPHAGAIRVAQLLAAIL